MSEGVFAPRMLIPLLHAARDLSKEGWKGRVAIELRHYIDGVEAERLKLLDTLNSSGTLKAAVESEPPQ